MPESDLVGMHSKWILTSVLLGVLSQLNAAAFAGDIRLANGCYFVVEHGNQNCMTLETLGSETVSYCLLLMPIITAANFKNVDLRSFISEGKQQYAIGIELDDVGRERFSVATGSHIGRRIAMAIEGKIAMAPIVKAKIESGWLQLNTYDHSSEDLLWMYKCLKINNGGTD
jgi:hypothetical protein